VSLILERLTEQSEILNHWGMFLSKIKESHGMAKEKVWPGIEDMKTVVSVKRDKGLMISHHRRLARS